MRTKFRGARKEPLIKNYRTVILYSYVSSIWTQLIETSRYIGESFGDRSVYIEHITHITYNI